MIIKLNKKYNKLVNYNYIYINIIIYNNYKYMITYKFKIMNY